MCLNLVSVENITYCSRMFNIAYLLDFDIKFSDI